MHPATAEELLADPATSFALKRVLRDWADGDPVDAAHDAACLARVLDFRASEALA